MKKTNQVTSPLAKAKASLRRGFSLIELLVVIAVIGIIAAIAIPNIAGLTGGAETARDQRNAQSIASVSATVIAAGYAFDGVTGTEAVAELIAGVADGDTPNIEGDSYKLDMDATDYPGTQQYLDYATATGFSYVKDGTGAAD